MLLDDKMNMSQQCTPAVQKAHHILIYIKKKNVASQRRFFFFPFYSAIMKHIWLSALGLSTWEGHELVEVSPEKSDEHLSYEERLELGNLWKVYSSSNHSMSQYMHVVLCLVNLCVPYYFAQHTRSAYLDRRYLDA